MKRPLLCRSTLLPGESLPSLLFRLAQENFYGTPRLLEQVCHDRLLDKDSTFYPTRAETFQVLADLTQVSVDELYRASVQSLAEVLTPPTKDFLTITLPSGKSVPLLSGEMLRVHTWATIKRTPFCPACLAESAYHRWHWFPVATAACLEHQCLLVYECPTCHYKSGMRDVVTGECTWCGFKLSQTPLTNVTEDEFGLLTQSIIQSWWGSTSMVEIASLGPHAPRTLYCLLDGLCRSMKTIRSQFARIHQTVIPVRLFPYPSKTNVTAAQVFVLSATAMSVILKGEKGFHKFFDWYQQRDNQEITNGLVKNFGSFYTTWLEKEWNHPSFQWMQEVFNQYINEHYIIGPGLMLLTRFKREPKLLEELPYITEGEAARILETTPEMVQRLVTTGLLSLYEILGDKRYSHRFRWINRPEVMALKEKWQGAIPLKEAAVLLAVSDEVVLDMVELKLLQAVRGRSVDGSYAWKISLPSILDLLDGLRARAVLQPMLDMANPDVLNLIQASQMLSAHGFKAARVLEYVLDGRLQAGQQRHLETLADLLFNADNLDEWLGVLRSNRPYPSMVDIMIKMHVGDPAVSTWIESGLLVPSRTYKGIEYFEREAVEAFVQGHVMVQEAAEILGIGELAVQKWARNGRLQPVSGPGVDERGVYLFRRADVERLRPENRLTGPQLAKVLGISRSQLWQWMKQGKVQPISGPGTGDGAKHYLFVKP